MIMVKKIVAPLILLLVFSCATFSAQSDGMDGEDHYVIAIFDFELEADIKGYEALATDVPRALTEAFIRGGIFRPVERSSLEKLLQEQEFSVSGLVDQNTAVKVGKIAGARYALVGSIVIIKEQIRMSCRVIDVQTGEIVYAKSTFGALADIFELEEELAYLIEEDFS
mgnify:CR=1 FL=1